jgi:hypothetical protein
VQNARPGTPRPRRPRISAARESHRGSHSSNLLECFLSQRRSLVVNPPKIGGNTFYRWFLAAVAADTEADAFWSWSHPESNPLLAKPGSNFDTRFVVLKSALLGASLLIECYALHHNPRLCRHFVWLNFTIAGALGGVRSSRQQ